MGTAVARMNRELPLTRFAVTNGVEGSLTSAGHETFQSLVMQALQLRRIYREVFILCDIKGYNREETAAILDISVESVARRLARARVQLGLNQQA